MPVDAMGRLLRITGRSAWLPEIFCLLLFSWSLCWCGRLGLKTRHASSADLITSQLSQCRFLSVKHFRYGPGVDQYSGGLLTGRTAVVSRR